MQLAAGARTLGRNLPERGLLSLRKAGKAVQKLLSGQFTELADRGREVLQIRRERQHYERGDLLFTTERFAEIFRKDFRHKYTGSHDGLDLVIAIREHRCSQIIPGFARRAEFASMLRSTRPEEADRIIRTANEILANRFPIFSLGYLDYGDPPRWNYDPPLNRSAPEKFYADIDYLNANTAGDAKVVWEPARFQFVYDLGQAYLLSGDERYAEKFFQLISRWSESHPDYTGIGFCSALEFTFRIHSLVWGIGFFSGSPALNSHAADSIYRVIWLGAQFISNHLSLWFSPNTHLLGEAYALYLVGTLLPEFTESERWRELGHEILKEELDRQFTLDGMHAELSTAYHAYALEFYIAAYLIAKVHADPLKQKIAARLPALTCVLGALQRPDGIWPHIGDEDGGRLFFLSRKQSGDFRPLLEAATILTAQDAVDRQVCHDLEAFWLTGAQLSGESFSCVAAPESHYLFNSGLFVSRDDQVNSQVILQCGPFGYLDAPHSHADMLHFELAVGADNFIVDPGTYVYTADLAARDRFRSPQFHNGPTINGAALMRENDPFGWEQKPDANCRLHAIGKQFGCCEAGYQLSSPQGGVDLSRGLLSLGDGCWLLWDRIGSDNPGEVGWNFISPHALVREGEAVRICGTQGDLLLAPICSAGVALDISLGKAKISEDYLSLREGSSLKLKLASPGEITLFMLMQRLPMSAEFVVAGAVEGGRCSWRTQRETHHLYIKNHADGDEMLRSDAEVVYQKEEQGRITRIILLEGSEISGAGGVILSSPEKLHYLDAVRTASGWQLDSSPAGVEVQIGDKVRTG
ncbi:MAG: heparinase II/III family protein [bacterium]